MPVLADDDNRHRVVLHVRDQLGIRLDLSDRLVHQILFELLAFRVLLDQLLGEHSCPRRILRQKELEGTVRLTQAAAGIDFRGDLERNIASAYRDRSIHIRGLHASGSRRPAISRALLHRKEQRPKSRPLRRA